MLCRKPCRHHCWTGQQSCPVCLPRPPAGVGAAVTDALQQFGRSDLQRKWPNDILHSNARLGGILIELSGDANGGSQPC